MKYCEIVKCKREALGMTQAELAELVGITGATISKYEKGETVSEIVVKAIRNELEAYIGKLSRLEQLQVSLLVQINSLKYETNIDRKLTTLNYITIGIGKLGLELRKEQQLNEFDNGFYDPDKRL